MISTIGIHDSVGSVFPLEKLQTALDDIDPEIRIVTTEELAGCDALVTYAYDERFLSADLQWIHSIQAGVDRFPFDELEAESIALTNSTGIHGEEVGETVAGYMLMFARRLHHYRTNQADESWDRQPWDVPFTLGDSSVCIVGLGALGSGIAMRADGLGMTVTGVKRTPTPVDHVDTVYPRDELHDAIADAKFVVLAVPLNDETEGLFGAAEIEAMRSDAILVNVARGGVVDQPALVDALEAGTIDGAALDVFETEPLPTDSPLWRMDDVIVTPHAAAVTKSYYHRIAALVRENATRWADDEELANRVV